MTQPLRILFVSHIPWDRNLGGGRVMYEIAEEWKKAGHQVEKFSHEDAFPKKQRSGLGRKLHDLVKPAFATAAARFLKANASRFDLIDAHQGNIPDRSILTGFNGLLVTRSVGLYAFYEAFEAEEEKRRPYVASGTLAGRIYYRLLKARAIREGRYEESLRAADLVNVPNQDEADFVEGSLGLRGRALVEPFGLTEERFADFKSLKNPDQARLEGKEIVFVGTWCARKGSKDWGGIIRKTWAKVPEARFLFLGTGYSEADILREMEMESDSRIEVKPHFDSADLPRLMRNSAVGAFPSYIEGFGFAVIEKMAAGLPVVAYDVPGPRGILKKVEGSVLVAPGDVDGFADALSGLLSAPVETYSAWSSKNAEAAGFYHWRRIAAETMQNYRTAINARKGKN